MTAKKLLFSFALVFAVATAQAEPLAPNDVKALLERIRETAPHAYVNLLADPPGRRLYAKHGFTETAPEEVGMAMTLGAPEPESQGTASG